MAKKTSKVFHIVWSPDKTEGFITNSDEAAEFVGTGFQPGLGVTTAGLAFRETFADEDEGIELEIQTLELSP